MSVRRRIAVARGTGVSNAYDREVIVSATDEGVNIAIHLYDKGDVTIAAGLTLPRARAADLLKNLALAISELPAAAPAPSLED